MLAANGLLFFKAVTVLGDSAVLFPASIGLATLLWASGARRSALAFAGALCFCVGTTIVAKLGFMVCGVQGPDTIYSPSGHASMSTFFYASLGFVAATTMRRAPGWLYALASLLLIGVIAASRVALEVHSVKEAALGVLIGGSSFGLFARFAAPAGAIDSRAGALLVGAPLAAFFIVGATINIEDPLAAIAAKVAQLTGC